MNRVRIDSSVPFKDTLLPQLVPNTELKPYIIFEIGMENEFCLLGFARRLTSMRGPAFKAMQSLGFCKEYTFLRMNRLWEAWPYAAACTAEYKENILKNRDFVVEDMTGVTCGWCGTWGELNRHGMCEMCYVKKQKAKLRNYRRG